MAAVRGSARATTPNEQRESSLLDWRHVELKIGSRERAVTDAVPEMEHPVCLLEQLGAERAADAAPVYKALKIAQQM